MSRAKAFVKDIFKRHLLLSNTVTCSCLFAAGDAIAQLIETHDVKQLDLRRIARYGFYGILAGPLNHLWYKQLDHFLPAIDKITVLKKIALDQLIAAPAFMSFFFISLGTLERRPLAENINTVKENFIPVYKIDLCVWPAAQWINFKFVPTHFRVTYVAFMTLCWNTFLAWYRARWVTGSNPENSFQDQGGSQDQDPSPLVNFSQKDFSQDTALSPEQINPNVPLSHSHSQAQANHTSKHKSTTSLHRMNDSKPQDGFTQDQCTEKLGYQGLTTEHAGHNALFAVMHKSTLLKCIGSDTYFKAGAVSNYESRQRSCVEDDKNLNLRETGKFDSPSLNLGVQLKNILGKCRH